MVRKYMKNDQISPIPAISVIMPVYNAEAYLTQSISTILAQTFRDFELLIIDDASTDKSLDICREFAKEDPRIHIYKQKKAAQVSPVILRFRKHAEHTLLLQMPMISVN